MPDIHPGCERSRAAAQIIFAGAGLTDPDQRIWTGRSESAATLVEVTKSSGEIAETRSIASDLEPAVDQIIDAGADGTGDVDVGSK